MTGGGSGVSGLEERGGAEGVRETRVRMKRAKRCIITTATPAATYSQEPGLKWAG